MANEATKVFPMPGEFWAAPNTNQVPNKIVIASVWLPWVTVIDGEVSAMEDGIGTLLLNPERPFYTVQLWYPPKQVIERKFLNIVPAAAYYQAETEAWGGA